MHALILEIAPSHALVKPCGVKTYYACAKLHKLTSWWVPWETIDWISWLIGLKETPNKLVSGSPDPDQVCFLWELSQSMCSKTAGLSTVAWRHGFRSGTFQFGLPKVCVSFFVTQTSDNEAVLSKDVLPTLNISLYLSLSFRKMSFTCSSGWRHSWRLLRRSLMCSRRSLAGESVTCWPIKMSQTQGVDL